MGGDIYPRAQGGAKGARELALIKSHNMLIIIKIQGPARVSQAIEVNNTVSRR